MLPDLNHDLTALELIIGKDFAHLFDIPLLLLTAEGTEYAGGSMKHTLAYIPRSLGEQRGSAPLVSRTPSEDSTV